MRLLDQERLIEEDFLRRPPGVLLLGRLIRPRPRLADALELLLDLLLDLLRLLDFPPPLPDLLSFFLEPALFGSCAKPQPLPAEHSPVANQCRQSLMAPVVALNTLFL